MPSAVGAMARSWCSPTARYEKVGDNWVVRAILKKALSADCSLTSR